MTTAPPALGAVHTLPRRCGSQPSRQPIPRYPLAGSAWRYRPRPAGSRYRRRAGPVAWVRGKEITIMTAEAGPVPRDGPITDLVLRARDGDQQAWDALVERYAPLVWSICRRYRLAGTDADDAGQAVWLQLVDHIGQIRAPAALPGWLATTTGRECARIVRKARRTSPPGRAVGAGDA